MPIQIEQNCTLSKLITAEAAISKQCHRTSSVCFLRRIQGFRQRLIIGGGAGRASGKLRHQCGATLGTFKFAVNFDCL